MSEISAVRRELAKYASKKRAKISQGFFKTGVGEYGEGDQFIGVSVPDTRLVARQFTTLARAQIRKLLQSKIHEERMVAIEILCFQYAKAIDAEKKKIVTFYLANRACINNWDLVDGSAPHIVGDWLIDKDRKILFELVRAKRLWDRRIAIIATYAFIKKNDFADTLRLAEFLLGDDEDLIHKAVGWMLREVGNRDRMALERFLKKYYKTMPRTMLRYAIEKFPKTLYKKYLAGTVG